MKLTVTRILIVNNSFELLFFLFPIMSQVFYDLCVFVHLVGNEIDCPL